MSKMVQNLFNTPNASSIECKASKMLQLKQAVKTLFNGLKWTDPPSLSLSTSFFISISFLHFFTMFFYLSLYLYYVFLSLTLVQYPHIIFVFVFIFILVCVSTIDFVYSIPFKDRSINEKQYCEQTNAEWTILLFCQCNKYSIQLAWVLSFNPPNSQTEEKEKCHCKSFALCISAETICSKALT